MMRRSRRSGLTLVELLLVLALVAILTAAAAPSIWAMYRDSQVHAGADHLRAKFAEARSRAIEEGRAYRFAVMPGQGLYKMAPDTSAYWEDAMDAGGAGNETTDQSLVTEGELPNKIIFDVNASEMGGSGNFVRLLTFLPDGTCDEDASIRLDMDGARSLEIFVRSLTGSVTVTKVEDPER